MARVGDEFTRAILVSSRHQIGGDCDGLPQLDDLNCSSRANRGNLFLSLGADGVVLRGRWLCVSSPYHAREPEDLERNLFHPAVRGYALNRRPYRLDGA